MTVPVRKTIVLRGQKRAHTLKNGDKELKSWSRGKANPNSRTSGLVQMKE